MVPDESTRARARERWLVVNVRAFDVAQIAPSLREKKERDTPYEWKNEI